LRAGCPEPGKGTISLKKNWVKKKVEDLKEITKDGARENTVEAQVNLDSFGVVDDQLVRTHTQELVSLEAVESKPSTCHEGMKIHNPTLCFPGKG
jgi:hypothetical protein